MDMYIWPRWQAVKPSPLQDLLLGNTHICTPTDIQFCSARHPESGKRYGDNMSLNIDKNGDGYIFFGENTAQNILRLTVSDHKNSGRPPLFYLPTLR